jgi:glutamine synthetase
MSVGLIEKFGFWNDDQKRIAADLRTRIAAENLRLIRVAWVDSHGHTRAKAVSVPAFLSALDNGYNTNVATFTLDASGGRVFRSFVRGGGMGLDEMTGSPNLIIVPDPSTFRVLPWAPRTGWILCDEYFTDGRPFHFSSRQILRRQAARLAERGLDMRVGLESEWYLRRVAADGYSDETTAQQGIKARPIATAPIEPGYSYHSETNMDMMQPVLDALADAYEALDLPLRSIENEFAPGQLETTFGAQSALRAADDYVLFRTATRQVCRRMGYFASFMCKPKFPGHYTNGWHLHQSLVDLANGTNLCMPEEAGHILSPLGQSWLAGLLDHAAGSAVFATPTINGYRRFRPNSLAPDRAGWGIDHRGAMIRVLGGPGDTATRYENRLGEPSANPYLFIASQIVAGLDGIERQLSPPPPDDAPYEAERPLLPSTLGASLEALEAAQLFRREFGSLYIDYYLALKRAELERYRKALTDAGETEDPDVVADWEQNEYFDFF